LLNARPLRPISISAKLSDYPPSAEKITWKLQISSVEQGDYVTILTALPSLSQTPYATSQILSTYSRVKDALSFTPTTPFSLKEGAIVLSLAIGFGATPTEEKYLFDTRTPVTLLNGIALKVEATGELTLLVANGTTTSSITSASVPAWTSGAVTEIVAEWDSNTTSPLRRISFEGTTVAEDTSTALPTGLDALTISNIQLGTDANATKHIDSEFIRVVCLKRPRA